MFCGLYFPPPFGVPMVERIRLLLYSPHTSALVAYNGGTSVGHDPVRTLFLSLILSLVPMTPCETMLYWPHTSALLAYNGGTTVGHGPVRTLFLEPDFVPSVGTLDVGHGPVRTLFLGLILSLVPMTPCETMLYEECLHLLRAHGGCILVRREPFPKSWVITGPLEHSRYRFPDSR